MLKKILIGFGILLVIAILFLGFLWTKLTAGSTEQITADLATEELFTTRCAICHGGALAEAPSISALKLLPEETIVATLKTGVMKNQAITLTDEQHRALAAYISDIDSDAVEEIDPEVGRCEAGNFSADQSAFPRVDGWGMGLNNQRYYDKEDLQLSAENVSKLKLDWAFAFPNSSRARVQPTIAGNTLFTASQTGTIYALDRRTGCTQWTYQARAEVRSALVIGRDSSGRANRLYFGDFNAEVYALDLDSRKLLWKKKVEAHPDATITGTLSLYNNRLYIPISSTEVGAAADENYACCTSRGSVVSLDAASGEEIWKTYTIDETPTQQGTNEKGVPKIGPSGAPVWTAVTIDSARGCLYIGSGENYTRPATKTSDAIIAFDLATGEKRWVQQTIPKDAWNAACVTLTSRANCPEDFGPDADFGAPPILVNYKGKDLLLAGQKSGHVYAIDPDDEGRLVWTTLVGRGGFMGGIHWGMATDGEILYVPINDRGPYSLNPDKPQSPGLHAVDIADGSILWSTIEEDRCGTFELRGCGPGLSAAITLTPEVVFGGTLDGWMKAYAKEDGRELWSFDTKRDYESVNGVRAFGGAIDSDGPVVVGNQLFVSSGYAKFAEKEGNVVLAFSIEE
ncbi:MAG: PQQ-binding-like beta-propeller repeat protein [Bacteroidota bacterium]